MNLSKAFAWNVILTFYNCKLFKVDYPHDTAMPKAAYKVIKIDFINQYIFENLYQLDYELFGYIN